MRFKMKMKHKVAYSFVSWVVFNISLTPHRKHGKYIYGVMLHKTPV